MNQQEQCWKIIYSFGQLFNFECYLCHGQFNGGKGFVIHHIKYKKGEKIYSDFKTRLEYLKYLKPIVRKNPKRFRLLHSKCHVAVERLKRYKPENRKRLVKLANE